MATAVHEDLPRERMLATIERLGWHEGMSEYLHGLPAAEQLTRYRELFSDDAGWVFLLAHAGLGRVLCLDAFPGNTVLALARLHAGVEAAQFRPLERGALERRLAAAGAPVTALTALDPRSDRLPFENGRFDAVVLSEPDLLPGREPGDASWSMVRFLGEARRVLSPQGFCCIKLRNRYAYGRARALLSGLGPLRPTRTTLRRLTAHARDLGFLDVVAHPALMIHERVSEVACTATYEPTTVGNSTYHTIKSALLGPGLSRLFAPGFVVTCSKGPPRTSFITQLAALLAADGALSPRARVRRYLLPLGKVILSLGRPEERHGDVVAVLPLQPSVLERRRHEAAILTRLASLPGAVSAVVPRMVAHGELHGQPYHVISELHGRAIDSPVPGLAEATGEACTWLAAFQGLTATERLVTPEVFAEFFGHPLERAAQMLGGETPAIARRIRARLEPDLLGRRIRTVWTHGDFKIENVLFDPATGRIQGVIDWDLSDAQGLPLIDLLYLLAYNRQLRSGERFDAVYFDGFLPARATAEEQALIAHYRARVAIDPATLPALAVMLWAHHVGRRLTVDEFSRELLHRLRAGFGRVEAALAAGA